MEDFLFESRKEMILNFLKDKSYKPMRFKELCMMFNVPRDERSDFKHILDTLI